MSKNGRILLVNPPSFKNTEAFAPEYMLQRNAFNYPPLGLLYLAANLPGHFECKIIDSVALEYTIDDCLDDIKAFQPCVVGFIVFTDSLYCCYLMAQKIKECNSETKVIFGGPHVNIYPDETIELGVVDYALAGFAENTFSALMTLLERGDVTNEELYDVDGLWWKDDNNQVMKSEFERDSSWDINKIRRPCRNLLQLDKYFTVANRRKITTMITSRGCPFSCTFCDVFEKRFLEISIDNIVDEIKEVLRLGIDQIHFFDDCLNVKRTRVAELCNAILDNNLDFEWSFRGRIQPCDEELALLLYKAGCRRIQLGIEATDQPTLDLIKKNITISKVPKVLKIYRKAGISTMGYFIFGFIHQNEKDSINSSREILTLGFDYINLFILIPYPNTQIYTELLNKKIIANDVWLEHARNPQPDFKLPIWHPILKRQFLEELILKTYRKHYFVPKFIYSDIIRTKNFNSFVKKFKLALLMLLSKIKIMKAK